MNMTETKAIGDFVRRKIEILNEETPKNQAMCAKLRRAIGKPPGSMPEIWDVTLQGAPDRWQGYDGQASNAEWAVHTALALYALHRQGKLDSMNSDANSFAAATARIILRDEGRSDAIRRRFNAVATAVEFTELAYHARGIIQLLKAEGIPMNYPQFAQDLFLFQNPGGTDRIRLRWGEDFYRVLDYNKGKEEDK